VYVRTLSNMGVKYTQAGKDWHGKLNHCDGVIVSSTPESHCEVASTLMREFFPVLIEKPVCMNMEEARDLLSIAKAQEAIVFSGHTRLYSTAWRAFKAKAMKQGVNSVYASAGGPCKIDPLFDWGSHLVAMSIDLGFDPLDAHLVTNYESWPLKFSVNGKMMFADVEESPTPLEVLLTEFMQAIEKGEPDMRGLEFGVKVVEKLEAMHRQREDMLWRSA
jgi:hypothetical protein